MEYASADDSPASFPDGGLHAWLVVLGSWCAILPSFGLMNTTGVFADWLASNQLSEYSHSSVSWIFSVYIFFLLVGGVQIGPIFDRYGPKHLLIFGTLGLTAAVMVLSVSKEYYQFMLGFGVLGGISASMVFTPSVSIVNHWFYTARALATGIVVTAGSIGGIIFPQIFNALAPSAGFGWAIRTLGFITLTLCSTGALLQRSRLEHRKTSRWMIDLRPLCEPVFTLTTIGIMFADIGATIPLTYLTSYARANGMTISQSYTLMSILNGTSILGRLIPGYAADRYGRFNAMVVTTAVSGILTLSLWLKAGSNRAAIISYAALFGFWSGSAISLSPVCVAQISETEDFGKRYGTAYIVVGLGVLVSLPIAGEILNAQTKDGVEHYQGLIVFCGLAYIASAGLFVCARGLGTRWAVRKKY
ncbi:MCT family MFS transporter [Aspergillus novofumigatus IBT 16806]|uniref:Putative monocarboxylate permease n=1 Tax=Aspergillus novofumigatus (strain IBT 16806) TaxID=1392255 RepID=A0A2I1BUM7_ASPN1|nr:putative monocarboxylate permease [Aspergillus novofumigatus IBT 16806]PKX89075.1 putative monocarboxylate permease [Aspergillus novofumigatus IBT 16806]